MAKAHHRGSCHCKAVRYEVELDLAKGTERCNCSICWKARAWFTIVQEEDFKLLTSPDAMGEYRWVPEGKSEPFLELPRFHGVHPTVGKGVHDSPINYEKKHMAAA